MRALIEPVAVIVLCFSCVAPTHAAATSGEELYAQGVVNKFPSCVACHGERAEGVAPFPRLAGLPTAYVVDQMRAYADGKRPNAVMQTIAKLMDDEQIAAVADYVTSTAAPFLPAETSGADVLATGARLVALGKWSAGVPACRDCHGPGLRGGGPALPGLAGQPEAYLLGQLKAFRDGTRPGGPLGLMARIVAKLDSRELKAAAAYAAALREGQEAEAPRGAKGSWQPRAQSPDHFQPPPDSALPAVTEDANAVLLGEKIFTNTPRYAAQFTGNTLSCRNCHTDRGRNPLSAPLWAAAPQYPMYRSKNRSINSLEMRIADCFRYSQNGTAPPADSPELLALMAYTNWLATGLPIGIKPKASGYPALAKPAQPPDRQRGAAVYAASCAVCHGATGQGSAFAGAQVIPALWGPQSYNWGAGMHTVDNAAAYAYSNMPLGAAGTLSKQQAWDVGAWINSQPRPQDPRYTESVEKTRELFHKQHAYEYYGKSLDGLTLGAP
ncbi:MAG: c-type cytochrome [Pseudomonadota bacterium]